MSRRARRRLVPLLIALAFAAGLFARDLISGDDEGTGGSPLTGLVVKVVDGDTINVALPAGEEKVRYIGVDTPETHHPRIGVQCYGRAASEYNARLVRDERVRLVPDVERRDRYGRLLAYVYRVRDGLFVNAALARDGYARPLTIPPDVRFAERFAALAREARERGRGLWGAC